MLLINPCNAEYGGNLSRFTPLSLPMSIGCLQAIMEQYGHRAEIWDEELERITEQNIDELVQGLPQPYVFGITVLTAQVSRSLKLSELLKKKYPDCLVIVGGYHPTAMPQEFFELTGAIDFVVRGEGERTIIELYEAFRQGKTNFSDIAGLSYLLPWVPTAQKAQTERTFFSTGERPLIKDLADLPKFPYDKFVAMLEKVKKSSGREHNYDWGFIVTSRGCPYKCTYCAQRMMTGQTYRWRPVEVVVEELDILINRFGAKSIFFLDDNFCFKRSRAIELCERIKQSGLGKKCDFSLQTRADNFYKELVPIMREAGFTSVGFGMETAGRLLDVIQKGETLKQHVEAIDLAKKNDMDVALFMIYGLPTETHADRKEIYKIVKSLGLRHCKFNNLMPYPGTPLYRDLVNSGRLNKVGHYENFVSTLSEMGSPLTKRKPLPYVPEQSSEWELMRDVIRYNLLLSLRWSIIKGVLLRRKGPGWFQLQEGWWRKPSEWREILHFAFTLLSNLMVALLPLFPLEQFLQWRNPKLQKRVPKNQIKPYVPSGWSRESWYKEVA